MRTLTVMACCALAALSLGACSGDAVAPERMKAPAQAVRATNPFHLVIEGQGHIPVGWLGCSWTARAYGGVPPHTYAWSTDGLSEEFTYGEYWYGHGQHPGYFDLTVQVTDAVGQVSVATIGVYVSDEARGCPG